MSDDILTICIGDQSACEGDDNGSPSPEAQEATPQGQTLNGSSQHAANADSTWMAATSAPDFCRVGNNIIGFESTATLESPVRYSPDVIAAGCELYRVGDLFQGIQGDAGQHVVSGTSLGSGHVLITGGQDNVKVNGLPMARHDSPCMINCNGAGVGGTPGYLVTRPQAVESTPGQSGEGGPGYNPGEEGLRVINDKWEGAKSAAKTAWEMLPFTGDEATTGAARDRAWQGAKDTYEAVDVLTGPGLLDLLDSGVGYATGDAERAGRFGEEWKRTGEAYGGLWDAGVEAWQEAEERNGTWGAMEMSVVVLIGELAGGKGTGVLRGATKIPDLETPSPPPNKGVHVESSSDRIDVNDYSRNGRVFNNEPIEWSASRPKGTQLDYKVFQRNDIDWDQIRTTGDKRFIGKTNAEAAARGLAPQLPDGNFSTLHHLGQKSPGPLVEASTRYHGVGKPGQDILHSQYGRSKPHPTLQPDRKKFDVDTREYWKWRSTNRGE